MQTVPSAHSELPQLPKAQKPADSPFGAVSASTGPELPLPLSFLAGPPLSQPSLHQPPLHQQPHSEGGVPLPLQRQHDQHLHLEQQQHQQQHQQQASALAPPPSNTGGRGRALLRAGPGTGRGKSPVSASSFSSASSAATGFGAVYVGSPLAASVHSAGASSTASASAASSLSSTSAMPNPQQLNAPAMAASGSSPGFGSGGIGAPVMAHTASGRSATGSHGKDVSLDDAYLLLDLPYQTAPSAPLPIPQTASGHMAGGSAAGNYAREEALHLSIDDDRPPLFYATSAPTDDEELVLAAQVLVGTQSLRVSSSTSSYQPPSALAALAAGKGLHGHPSSIAMGFHGSHGHGVAGNSAHAPLAHHAHNAHNATHIPGLGRIGPASSSASLLSASFPRTVTDIRRTSTSAAPVFSWLVDDSAAKPQQPLPMDVEHASFGLHPRHSALKPPLSSSPPSAASSSSASVSSYSAHQHQLLDTKPAGSQPQQQGMHPFQQYLHVQQQLQHHSPSTSPSSASSVVVSPNAKATKSRRKTANAESRLASSTLAGNATGRSSVRKKRNPQDREESVERKSASPSPSRSLGGSGRSRSSVPSLPSSQLSDGPVPMDTDTPLADLAATPPKAIPSYAYVRQCSYCQATTTPMWRHGPAGYPDLCNKCGVKWMRGRILQDLGTSTSSSSVASTPSGFVAAAGPLSTTSGGGGTTHKSEG
ncbi:hypothetical protein BC831DRAFT_547913 [Entophlyctis helioformis]|nr:hypothetical protein BC831DRAFT_547913 [Entophlyctis helioformis]